MGGYTPKDIVGISGQPAQPACFRYGEDSREEALSKQTVPFWTQLRVATWNIMGPMVPWFDAKVLGKLDHDLTVLPHWKSWFLYGNSSPNGRTIQVSEMGMGQNPGT